MLSKIKFSITRFNYRLYAALLILGFVPAIYTTFRVFMVGQLPDAWSFSIAGQLSWVNLLYEILNEAIILPLFFFVANIKEDKQEFANRIRTGMLISFLTYSLLSAVIFVFAKPMLLAMAIKNDILDASAKYIRIESVANVFSVLMQFALVSLVSINKSRYIYIFTGAKLLLSLFCDTILVSLLPFSLNLGINGIGYSNIIVNIVLLSVSLYLLSKENIYIFSAGKLRFQWIKSYFKVGGISGLESFVRNFAYMLIISRMVNVVGEQGTYWVANNFIWGWLLMPVLQLGELIKQEVAADHNAVQKNSLGYFIVTAVISAVWFISIPFWKSFMTHILGLDDVTKLYELVLLLVGFYVLYAFQNVFDATFYGLGKTQYMLLESVVTNTVYYGIAFVLYITNVWTPTLTGIAWLFGIGNVFDSFVSFLVYRYFLRKEKIKILV